MTQQAEAFDPIQETQMTLMEHLIELRTRLIWVVGALLIGTLVAMIFVNPILRFITEPLTELGAETIAIGPTDTITIFFKVSITVGAVIAMPVIVYQIIAFAAPGLYPHEKRMLILILPGIMVLFLIGAAFAYFVLMPVAVGFLQGFLGDVIRQEWTIDRYIGFVTRVVFWIGVAFEMPLVLAFLARAGIVSGRQLLGFWRQAVVIIAVVAAAITPTVDPINMSIVMGPLLVLYLGSCGLAHLVYRPREPRDFSDGFMPHEDEDEDAGEEGPDPDDGGDDDEPPSGPSGSAPAVTTVEEADEADVEEKLSTTSAASIDDQAAGTESTESNDIEQDIAPVTLDEAENEAAEDGSPTDRVDGTVDDTVDAAIAAEQDIVEYATEDILAEDAPEEVIAAAPEVDDPTIDQSTADEPTISEPDGAQNGAAEEKGATTERVATPTVLDDESVSEASVSETPVETALNEATTDESVKTEKSGDEG